MTSNQIFILFLFSVVAATGCKKKEETSCVAGNGGKATIVIYPKHHGKAVRPYKAYVKFNAKDAPSALSGYDLVKNADTTEDHIELTGLKCGDYYIYAEAYDTSIRANVKGGLPYSLSSSVTSEISTDIFVTE